MMSLRRAVQPASIALRGVRYSHGTHGHSGDPKEIEQEKQKNLRGEAKSSMDKHAPGWNEKLASDSEAKVKALKDKRSPEQLQKDTVEHQKKSK